MHGVFDCKYQPESVVGMYLTSGWLFLPFPVAYCLADAVRVGRLHVLCEGWADASLQYMRGGGFSVSAKVPNIATETLILWGRQDEILDPKRYAQRLDTIVP